MSTIQGQVAPPPVTPQRPRKRHPVLFALSMISLIVVATTVGVAMAAGGHPPAAHHRHGKIWRMQHQHIPDPASNPVNTQPPPPRYSVPEQQAIASAESYLQSEPGWSRLGLIDQLSSQYGEGFSHRLAVFAVNHVHVNWRQQAVYSAKSYMQSEPGWSCSGLVEQLSSSYGSQFTVSQAEHGAKAVGVCS